jgi:CO/xanthine dehydrogenase Mo-binding subunit
MGKGRGLGIAAHRSFLTYVATVVEVEVDSRGQVHIPNVWTAVDAGTIVSPDNIRNQFEGAAVFGTSLALFSEITATNGAIDQSNFHNYQITRMNRAPRHIEVHIVEKRSAARRSGRARACRRLRRRSTTQCSRPPASACASFRCRRRNWCKRNFSL